MFSDGLDVPREEDEQPVEDDEDGVTGSEVFTRRARSARACVQGTGCAFHVSSVSWKATETRFVPLQIWWEQAAVQPEMGSDKDAERW